MKDSHGFNVNIWTPSIERRDIWLCLVKGIQFFGRYPLWFNWGIIRVGRHRTEYILKRKNAFKCHGILPCKSNMFSIQYQNYSYIGVVTDHYYCYIVISYLFTARTKVIADLGEIVSGKMFFTRWMISTVTPVWIKHNARWERETVPAKLVLEYPWGGGMYGSSILYYLMPFHYRL